ncbi:MAG: YdcF family protein [Myxococcales bacterium]|nr:YdcF family protein [Myxococcales bacterium]
MGFLLKKMISAWLAPLPVALVLLALGLWWTWSEETWKRGWWTGFAGFLLLYGAALPPTAHFMLAPLEANSPGYQMVASPAEHIVILGAGYHPVPGRPLTGQVSGSSVTRVTEAVRIARLHPKATVHCTGYGAGWTGSNAEAACAIAEAIGVPKLRLKVHPAPRDTEEEAAAIARSVGAGPVVLVTHAAHMPRARALFERAGVMVHPAPTGHVSGANPHWTAMPSSASLGTTSGAWHEWLGRWWVDFKDLFGR